MKTRECPSCGMEIEADNKVCPVCGYEFPRKSKGFRLGAILLAVLLLIWLFFIALF